MWMVLSLLAGLGDALRDAFSKRAGVTIPRPLITWSYSLFALPFFIPNLFKYQPENIPAWFWPVLLSVSSAHVLGGLLLVKALRLSELSLCTPLVAFTPVFLLILGPLVAGDPLSRPGIIGAILVAAGSYVLHLGRVRDGLLVPLQAVFREQGSRIMLGLAFLWSITASIDRVVVRYIHPTFWGSALLCSISILLIPIVIRTKALDFPFSRKSLYTLFLLGSFNALSLVGYLIALQTAPVHFVVCLKRSSILFSVFLGRLLFGESLIADRLPGALLMLLGVVIISLYG